MYKETKGYVCSKLRLMLYLVRRDFDCLAIRQDELCPKRVVFIFADSPELRDAVAKYYEDKE